MVLTMILAGVAIVALVIGTIWYVFARGSEATTITQGEFDEAYDELVGKGEIVDTGRDEAWKEFNSWQVTNEQERRSWEEDATE